MFVESLAIFLDTSGSVGGSTHYWDTVYSILAQFGNKITNFYFWNSNCEEIKRKRFQQAINQKKGWGGTSPETVARQIKKKSFKNIILITDGQVSDSNVKQCDKILLDYQLLKSYCYIISSGSSGLNMSVTCPFTRNCENKVFSKKKDEPMQTQMQFKKQDFKMLDQLNLINLQNFQQNYQKLQGLVIALNMGKSGNIELKNQLVVMKNRMVKQLSIQMSKGNEKEMSLFIRQQLQTNNFEKAMVFAKTMTDKYFQNDQSTSLEKKVSHLINLCGDLTGKYNLNEIKSNKIVIAKDAISGKVDKEVQLTDLTKTPIECPIIMDEDIPQIMIDDCQPLLLGIEKNIVDDISVCPLRILNYAQVLTKFKKRLSNFMGVKIGDQLLKNPFTQNKLLGMIPLGTHESHIKVGNYTLAKMLTGGKILGNLNMYYAVVWYLIYCNQIPYLTDIKQNATQHLIYRLKISNTMASLCGQAQFVTTEIKTDIAIWYCVNSGYLNQPTDRDTFRFHLFNLQPMVKILEVLNYPIHAGFFPYYNRSKALMNSLSRFKKMSTDQKKNFKNKLLGLYQNGIFVDTTKIDKKVKELQVCTQFVPIDGPATPEQVQKVRNLLSNNLQVLSNQEIWYIGGLLDAQKSASDIFLDYNIKIPDLPKFLVQWAYGLKMYDKILVKINPKTLRPYYKKGQKIWQQQAEQVFKIPLKKMFMGCKFYIGFLEKYLKRPTIEQLIIFYYNRYIEAQKTKTLPLMTEQWAKEEDQVYCFAYEKFNNIKNMLQIINESRKIENRIKMENS